MTHADLVEKAAAWLEAWWRCELVFTEARAKGNKEQPDAIGWTPSGLSIVIEAKSKRKDFHDDWRPDRKEFRRDEALGMGSRRYYIAPPTVVRASDVEKHGWGLLTVWDGRVYNLVGSRRFPRNAEAEVKLLARLTAERCRQNHQLPLFLDGHAPPRR